MPTDDSIYRQLQIQLDRYPIGYPATKSGVEIDILKYFFTPLQAKIALCLTLRSIPIAPIRKRLKNKFDIELSHDDLAAMREDEPVWLEDESRNVGKCSIPKGLWERMQQAEFHLLETPTEIRIERLMQEYAGFMPSLLSESILKIEKRIGYEKCHQALEACHHGDLRTALGICLAYYDKSYTFQIETRLKSNK